MVHHSLTYHTLLMFSLSETLAEICKSRKCCRTEENGGVDHSVKWVGRLVKLYLQTRRHASWAVGGWQFHTGLYWTPEEQEFWLENKISSHK